MTLSRTFNKPLRAAALTAVLLIVMLLNVTQTIYATQPTGDLIIVKSNTASNEDVSGGPTTWDWILTISVIDPENGTFGPWQVFFSTSDLVLVYDQLPDSPYLSYGTPTITAGYNFDCQIDSNSFLLCETTNTEFLQSTEDVVITIPVTATGPGTFTNPTGGVCRVNPEGHATNETNVVSNDCNEDEVVVTATGVDLFVHKTFIPDEIYYGELVNLSVTLTNLLSVPIYDVDFVDDLPTDVQTYNSTLVPPCDENESGTDNPFTINGTSIRAAGIDLDPGESCTIIWNVDPSILSAGLSYVNNQDNIDYISGEIDNLSNEVSPLDYNNFSAELTVNSLSDGNVIKYFDVSSAQVGDTVTMTLLFGLEEGQSVDWTDDLPAILGSVSPPDFSTQTLAGECSFSVEDTDPLQGSILSDEVETVCALYFNFTCVSAGSADNTVDALFENGEAEDSDTASIECTELPVVEEPPTPDDDDDDDDGGSAPIIAIIDPAITKRGSVDQAEAGETVVWTVEIFNPGSSPTSSDVYMQDFVPEAFAVTSVSVAGNGVVVSDDQTVEVSIGTLQPGESVIITITTVAQAGYPGQNCNTASARFNGQPSATDCVLLDFPDGLPPTGGQPVREGPSLIMLVGIAAALIALAGGVTLVKRRT